MAKVPFAMNDSVLRRAGGAGTREKAAPDAGSGKTTAPPEDPPAEPARQPGRRATRKRAPSRSVPELVSDVAAAKPVRQTSVTLPIGMWEEMADLARELEQDGISLRQQELLVGVLRYHAPATVESAAELFETYLALPPGERFAGEDSEERNFRLPVEVRSRLSEQANVLRTLSRDANRGTLIAATWRLHGPRSADDARELLALLRRADLRRALQQAEPGAAAEDPEPEPESAPSEPDAGPVQITP
jgi:hypothetical protein